MPARYSVIQYLPDPATDERINFGVVAFSEGEAHSRFVRNWRRIASFGPDVEFLKDFARQVEAITSAQVVLPVDIALVEPEALEAVAGKWVNSIQITKPRASTLEAGQLVDETAKRFLRERVAQKRRGRDRRAAAGLAARSLMASLRDEGSRKPEKYVQRNRLVEGQLDEHDFDVALVNGAPKFGVLAMSFELGSAADVHREIRANAWTIDDVRPRIPVAVVALPPRRATKNFDHAVDLFDSLGAEVVMEEDVPTWADGVAQSLYDTLVAR
jgi:hypothetical protein